MNPDLDLDVLVVGSGLAGGIAAMAARDLGANVALVRRSSGATALSSGAISVAPDPSRASKDPLASLCGPVEAAQRLAALKPDHPYAMVGPGLERLSEALEFATRQLSSVLVPVLERPRILATPYGTAIACASCQRSMEAGDLLAVRGTLAVFGFARHLGFDAKLVAAGLTRLLPRGGPRTVAGEVALPGGGLETATPVMLARALEAEGAAEAVGLELRKALPKGSTAVLLPPVLGLTFNSGVVESISRAAGIPVAESLSDVPSVPGVRLQGAMEARLAMLGIPVLSGTVAGGGPGCATLVAGRRLNALSWVLATGRFVGGGIVRRGALHEPVLGLPVQAAEGRESGVHLSHRPAQALTTRDRRGPQPLLSAGLRAGADLRPKDERGRTVGEGLYLAGAVLGGHEHATDGTGLGVAILTGFLSGRAAAKRTRAEGE